MVPVFAADNDAHSPLASRSGRYCGPRGTQPDRESDLPAGQLSPVAVGARRYRARYIAEPQWARTGVPCRLDDAV